MINIKDCSIKYEIKIKKIKKINNSVIIYSDNNSYLLREKSNIIDDYFPLISDKEDNYNLYVIYNDDSIDINEKAIKLLEELSNLHLKTIYYDDIDYDLIYKDINDNIDSVMNYYLQLQDYLEYFYIARSDYLLLLENISSFYRIISKGKYILDEWYSKKNFKIRKCCLINNLKLDNFIFHSKGYFIDYSKYNKDIIIKDFVNFYKNEFMKLDMKSLFELYQEKVILNEGELDLLFVFICIPSKIVLSDNINSNIKTINSYLKYIKITFDFISEKYKKNQKEDEDKFK